MRKPWPEDFARKVWRILVEECGAPNYGNYEDDSFVFAATRDTQYDKGITEYRFCGSLGFGGKVWHGPPPYVTCYKEDETPERRASIEKANKRLTELWASAKM